MTGTTGSERGDRGTAVAASAAGIAAAGAFACAACCILPFTLPAAALAVTGGMLAWLASIYEGEIIVAHTKAARGGDGNSDARGLRHADSCLLLAGNRADRCCRAQSSLAGKAALQRSERRDD